MNIQIKKQVGNKWYNVNIQELAKKSVLKYIIESKEAVVCAVFENSAPIMFISNNSEQKDRYKEKGLSFMAEDLMELVGSELIPSAFVTACNKTFGKTEFIEMELEDG